MIADLAQFHGIQPLFASVLPISDYHRDVNPSYAQSKVRSPNTIRELNDWLQHMCEQRHFTYVDYFSVMTDQAGWMPADMADDGLHPNAKGYRVMAPVALAALDKVAAKAPPSSPVKTPKEKPVKTTKAQPAAAPAPVQTAQKQEPKKKKNPFSIFTRSTAPPETKPQPPQN
jgi:hypothetical protein